MPELPDLHDSFVATRRSGLRSLQCLRTFPQVAWPTSSYQSQDRRDQEPQSSQNCQPRSEEEGELGFKSAIREYVSNTPQFEQNGVPTAQTDIAAPPNAMNPHRRVSQMAASVTSDRSHSPISRTGTPAQHDPNIAPQHIFDSAAQVSDQHFNGSPSLPSLHLNHPSPGAVSLNGDRHLETPMTYDQLVAANTSLRTRVSELEVINMVYSDNENSLRAERDRALVERDELKRKVEDLERRLHRLDHDIEHPAKKPRLSQEPQE